MTMREITQIARFDEAPDCPLTKRERQVLELIANGLDQNEIAGAIYRSRRTVDKHTQNLRRKLAATTLAQAVSIAWSKGWLRAANRALCLALVALVLGNSDPSFVTRRPASRCQTVRPATVRRIS